MQQDIQIYNKDCFELIKQIKEEGVKVNAIITDPPYGLMGKHKIETGVDWSRFSNECYEILEDNSIFGWFQLFKTADKLDWFKKTKEAGFTFKEEIIWDKKQTANPMLQGVMRSHENFYLYQKGSKGLNNVRYDTLKCSLEDTETIKEEVEKFIKGIQILSETFRNYDDALIFIKYLHDKHLTEQDMSIIYKYINKGIDKTFMNIYDDKKPNPKLTKIKQTLYGSRLRSVVPMISANKSSKEKFKHPNVKPVALIEQLIKLTTKEGDLVFDPFIGSGTTAIACHNTNRRFIGGELDPTYFEMAQDRILKATQAQEKPSNE